MEKIIIKYETELLQKNLPFIKTVPGDAGYNLYNASDETVTLPPFESVRLSTGIKVILPKGCCGFIKAHHTLFLAKKLFIVDEVIDSGFDGTLFLTLWHPNLDNLDRPVLINPWENLAQLIVVSSPNLMII